MLYLVQHGIAMDKEEDPDRPLTERGREEGAWKIDWILTPEMAEGLSS